MSEIKGFGDKIYQTFTEAKQDIKKFFGRQIRSETGYGTADAQSRGGGIGTDYTIDNVLERCYVNFIKLFGGKHNTAYVTDSQRILELYNQNKISADPNAKKIVKLALREIGLQNPNVAITSFINLNKDNNDPLIKSLVEQAGKLTDDKKAKFLKKLQDFHLETGKVDSKHIAKKIAEDLLQSNPHKAQLMQPLQTAVRQAIYTSTPLDLLRENNNWFILPQVSGRDYSDAYLLEYAKKLMYTTNEKTIKESPLAQEILKTLPDSAKYHQKIDLLLDYGFDPKKGTLDPDIFAKKLATTLIEKNGLILSDDAKAHLESKIKDRVKSEMTASILDASGLTSFPTDFHKLWDVSTYYSPKELGDIPSETEEEVEEVKTTAQEIKTTVTSDPKKLATMLYDSLKDQNAIPSDIQGMSLSHLSRKVLIKEFTKTIIEIRSSIRTALTEKDKKTYVHVTIDKQSLDPNDPSICFTVEAAGLSKMTRTAHNQEILFKTAVRIRDAGK